MLRWSFETPAPSCDLFPKGFKVADQKSKNWNKGKLKKNTKMAVSAKENKMALKLSYLQ